MALWMTVRQEVFGLAAMLLVFSCAFVHMFVRGKGRGKSRQPVLSVWKTPVFCGVTIAMVVTVGLGCVVGVWRMELEQRVICEEETWIAACDAEDVELEGTVAEIGETEYGCRIVLEDVSAWKEWLTGKSTDKRKDGVEEGESQSLRKLYVYLDADPGVKLGMRVQVKGELSCSESARNPGQFDFRLYCLAKKICGSLKGKFVRVVDSHYLLVQEGLRQIGLRLEERLELIADEEDVGLLKAILLGEKGDMDDEVYKLYQRNGISHVLAISGLHVSVIGMGLWNGLRKFGAGYWEAGVAAFGMVFCFGSIAGFGPSVVRAVFMMGISFLAGAFGRTYDLPSAMAVPGMGLLLWNPYVLTQASFQLSFLAVFAIFFPGAYLAKTWRLTGMWQNVWTSVSIQIVTLPIVLYHSFELAVYSILLNLVVVPLMTYVLVSGIIGLAGSFLWMPLGAFLLGGAHYILAFYKQACELASKLTGAYLVLGRPTFGAMAVYYMCMMGVILWSGKVKRNVAGKRILVKWPVASKIYLGAVWLAGVLILIPVTPAGLEVTFLDVGQGDGILIRSGGRTILVDGGSSQEKNLGEDCLVPALKSQGIDCLDAVFVTHGDQDHINGIRYLLEETELGIEIGQLVMPVSSFGDEACGKLMELAEERGIDVSLMGVEGIWRMEKIYGEKTSQEQFWKKLVDGDLTVTCLHPSEKSFDAENEKKDRNDGSLVLLMEYGDFRLLLTGDVEENGEGEIVKRGFSGPVTVLKAAHHGSASSTSQEFLDAVNPAYVIFSYGSGNRYGHPADEVVERCAESGAEIYETAKSGAIRIRTDGKTMQIRGWLDRREGI